MKVVSIFGIVAMSFLLMGCPYSSTVPIDEPSIKVDKRMLGTWIGPETPPDYPYTVTAKGEYSYLVEKKADSSDFRTQYSAHISLVGKTMFFNLFDDEAVSYYLYRLEITKDGKTLTLTPVDDKIERVFESSGELKDFILKNMDKPGFFDESNKTVFQKEVK
jgi:virulence-associated protein VagC